MDYDQTKWRSWVQALHRWGIAEDTAALLEAAGPLTLIAAQVIYFSQPLFRMFQFDTDLKEMVCIFEDGRRKDDFIALLRADYSE